ncbi:DUF808 domain-containing protein [Pseudogemmobacter faecipullorum]|uniref:DUF808 domain-containing protein n=1 Tax=Pseudogemmobacter faecipullorum TaxID=2755041 RepID=A0ABS8CIC4_9RHOB|nr:DUF808 domain-containing protein [Pseudogemmobacter faecipullorum]MCB5409139.1 DUF808 domain-containing protein [Pseudogemmobacter faecipullorum]
MSGLLALLDDVSAIAKIAAASVDDIAANAAKAGTKAMGVLIDDAAVTPKYVTGFQASRELPIIWRIARGSIFNKMVILLPALMLLESFLPDVIPYLLMLGGAYLCFEGAEKIWHALFPHDEGQIAADMSTGDPLRLEEERVAGAIKTDFILSAEIMTLSLSVIESNSLWMQGITLAVVAVLVTALVYGVVAVIVKLDDMGLYIAETGRTGVGRSFGRGLVHFVPVLLKLLSVIGTAAMLWVGGNIVLHGLDVTGIWSWPYQTIHHIAEAVALQVGTAMGFVSWAVTALFDGIFGLIFGLLLIPVALKVIGPVLAKLRGKPAAAGH